MRLVLLAISALCAALSLSAQGALAGVVSARSAASLLAGQTVRQSIPGDGSLALLPACSSQAQILAELRSFKPSVGVELMRLITVQGPAPDGRPSGWLRLYNTLHAVSRMQGTTYWSVTRGKEQVLFSQSYAVSAPPDARRIPDPSFEAVPVQSSFYSFQEDRSFGRNTYLESFSFPGDNLSVKIENVSTISLLLIPVVKPGSFVVRVLLLPAGPNFLFYGAAVIRTSFPIGDHKSREDSLAFRLIAMVNWLQRELGPA